MRAFLLLLCVTLAYTFPANYDTNQSAAHPVANTTVSQCGSMEQDRDYTADSNLCNWPNCPSASSAEECCALCGAHPGCIVASFFESTCYMHNSDADPITKEGVTAVKPVATPTPPPTPTPPGGECLCVFDIDRTLTGKQSDTGRCPMDQIIHQVWDPAYGGGWLTLSDLAQHLSTTFCSKCNLGVVSAGTGGGGGERGILLQKLQGSGGNLPSSTWSPAHSVVSPLVTSWPDGQKQHAVEQIVRWYENTQKIQIPYSNVHFYDDRSSNIWGFKGTGINAHQISCGHRDGSVGLCGAATSEITPALGVTVC